MTVPTNLVILRQVEGTRWCVVRHTFKDGKRVFAGRIATARDYAEAAPIAMEAARSMRMSLGIEGNGMMLRRFDRERDMPAPESKRPAGFSCVYGGEDS
ncbi:hypothetical protein D9601_10320 [Sphingomonas sp. MA1305]|uniref:hypothetical protein n=1 Tax=Sphingomonas sp. MA1305 TaxID=2479204 RepID=UPI0018DFC1EB|nr:hypothetical protein [Sphingomonas sp. MA1305]MBI0475746.1 hypothetical protein [Sphingomonas sp. MA1305]